MGQRHDGWLCVRSRLHRIQLHASYVASARTHRSLNPICCWGTLLTYLLTYFGLLGTCKRGDDPLSQGQSNEKQLIVCSTSYLQQQLLLRNDITAALTAGTFSLKFGQQRTRPLARDVSAAALSAALGGLSGELGTAKEALHYSADE